MMKKLLLSGLICTMVAFLFCSCSSKEQENEAVENFEDEIIIIEKKKVYFSSLPVSTNSCNQITLWYLKSI